MAIVTNEADRVSVPEFEVPHLRLESFALEERRKGERELAQVAKLLQAEHKVDDARVV